MAREFFKNLPDTTTPLEASRINGLLDGEESMGSIVVDDVNCKNLVNEANGIVGSYYNEDTQTIEENSAWIRTDFIPINIGSVSVSFNTNNNIYLVKIQELNENKGFIRRTQIGSNTSGSASKITQTITLNSNTKYIIYEWATTGNRSSYNHQMEIGSNITNYVPYKKIIKEQGGYVKEDTTFYANDFKCKNLATFGYGSVTANQVTTTFNNSSFTIDGTANASGYSFQKVICTLPAGTYTISTKLASGSKSGTSFQMTLVSATTDYVVIPSNTTDRIATFTLTEETELKFRLYVNNTNSMTFNNMVIDVQIEKGSVATTWTSFKEFDNVGKVLYDNATGTNNADIVLSDNTQNYSYFDFIINNTAAANNYLTIRIPANINRINLISYISGDANNLNIHYSVYHFNNEAKILYNWAGKVIFQGGAVTQSYGNNIYVKKIIGYK